MALPKEQKSKELEAAIKAFKDWRSSRKKICQIPECLWKRAAKLSLRYPINIICKNLGLNWGALKKKIDQLSLTDLSAKTNRPVKFPSSSPFIELKLPSPDHEEPSGRLKHNPSLLLGHSPSLRCALELTKPDGTVMKIFASNEAPLDLLELFKTFLER